METIDKQFSSTELNISTQSKNYLLEVAKWANFLSIVGFVFSGLYVLGGLMFFVTGASYSAFGGGSAASLGFVYIISAVLMFFPSLYLYNFSNKMKAALNNGSPENLELSLENLKSCFKFMGIMTIISLGLIILFVILGVLGASMM